MSKLKKNIYMVQINTEYAGSVYLPYAVGCLAAYAWSAASIREQYCLQPFVYRRGEITQITECLERPFLVAFSVYLWNFAFSKALARQIKKAYPDCLIVFGGHSTPCTESFLKQNPYIDYLIAGEGEQPFAALLNALSGKNQLNDVPSLIYRNSKGAPARSGGGTMHEIDYPSPYLEGYFNDILINDSSVRFSAIVETNRGCPYRCSYCDWGLLNTKVRRFPAEKVLAEINWVSTHQIEYLYVADANFGMFAKDFDYAKEIAAVKEKNGFPLKLFVNYTKNSNIRVFEITDYLSKHQLSKGATLSFQSFSPTVLRNIHRSNMDYKHFSELMRLYNDNNIMTYSELILGLPGETYESFAASLGKLLEAGQHTSIIAVKCHCLENAEMSQPEYIKKHGIETVDAPIDNAHSAPLGKEHIPETSRIVVATATMSREMWVETELLSLCVQCFHSFGLLRYIAVYLYHEQGIRYEVFYRQFIDWLKQNARTFSGSVFDAMRKEVKLASQGTGNWYYCNETFGKLAWPFEEGMFLQLAYDSKRFYSDIKDFLLQYPWEDVLLDELLDYQMLLLKLPGKADSSKCFSYDLHAYFRQALTGRKPSLQKRANTLKINTGRVPDSWERYGVDIVWFGRRGGSTLHSDIEQLY